RLRGWLDDDLEGQRILHHVAIAADSWDALGRPDSELYRGVRLAKALEWQDTGIPTLTETEQAFLAAGKRLSEAELRAAEGTARYQIRVNRRLRTALATAAFLLVGSLIAGFVAVGQAERAAQEASAAERAAVVADAGRAGAKAVVQDDIGASMLLAVAGVQLDETSESRANLFAVLAKHPELIRSVETEKLNVFGLDVSRDGQVVLNDQDGTALLYNPATGQLNGRHKPVNRPDGAVFGDTWGGGAIAFNPAGRHLAVGMPTPTTQPVRLLDPKTLEPIADSQQLPRFTNVPARATNVGHSRDGNSLFAVVEFYANGPWNDSTTGSLLVWDIRPGAAPKVRMTLPLAADATAGRLELSPDGGRLYTSTPLAAYDVATGKMLFRQPELASGDIDITGDGKLLALHDEFPTDPGAADGGVRLVDAATGRTERVLPGNGQEVTRILFSHDGTRLISTSTDLTAKMWDVRTGLVAKEIRVGDQEIQGIGFSPDDTTLYTAKDGMLRSWDLTGRRGDIVQVKGPTSFTHGCMIPAPGGRTVYREFATDVPWHHRIRFIDVATGRSTPSRAMDPGQGIGGCGAWNPAGNRFATANQGVITVWNTVTGEVVVKRRPASVDLMSLSYGGEDGSRIVIGEASGIATALDSETLEPVGTPVQVGASVNGISAGRDNRTAFVLTGGRRISADLNAPATG
ncbi:MAG TPA: WD40 repeat domain-containing protein, partial [Kribbella sp.]|nr:WD40 repeat domain-containing protein [Kribbella sp.]